MDSKKKTIILSIVAIATLILLLGGATFAYLAVENGKSTAADITVQTYTVDSFSFEVGDNLNITANMDNFSEGAGNRETISFAKATLKANNKTNNATRNYNMYLNIEKNEFVYSTKELKPELMITVTDEEGNIIIIPGLREVKDEEENVLGYDITIEEGLVTLLDNHEITSTGTKVENWNIKVTFLNLPDNQNANSKKLFSGKVIIQEKKINTFASYIKGLYNENGEGYNGLYLHDGTKTGTNGTTIIDAGDYSLRYSGGDYKLTDLATTGEEPYITIEDNLITMTCNEEPKDIGVSCATHKYNLAYENGSNNEGYNTYNEALNKAVEDGYLTNDNVKNYVCFGYDGVENCPEDNLYRIIGVFGDKVKIIKADAANSNLLGTDGDYKENGNINAAAASAYRGFKTSVEYYYWNKENKDITFKSTKKYNVWSYSALNNTNLNKNFLANIGNSWSDKIAKTVFNNTYSVVLKAKSAYNYDMQDATSPYYPVAEKVGLMYLSDYAYGAAPKHWETKLGSGGYNTPEVTSDNWLYLGLSELLISRYSSSVNNSYRAMGTGILTGIVINSTIGNSVRPTFYLKSTVEYNGGSGTASDPYIIK